MSDRRQPALDDADTRLLVWALVGSVVHVEDELLRVETFVALSRLAVKLGVLEPFLAGTEDLVAKAEVSE